MKYILNEPQISLSPDNYFGSILKYTIISTFQTYLLNIREHFPT